jgi:hypothetical protein
VSDLCCSEMNKAYAEKAFWDERYDESAKSSRKTISEGDKFYEWYVPFESIKQLLLSDIGSDEKSFDKSILLPGCGNSGLGEDLARQGLRVSLMTP